MHDHVLIRPRFHTQTKKFYVLKVKLRRKKICLFLGRRAVIVPGEGIYTGY